MTVYATSLSPAWREAFAEFENLTGFEMMHQEAVDSGEMTPREAWDANLDWLQSLFSDVSRIATPEDGLHD